MSITAFVGLPGAGKSYIAVARVILPALKAGRTVVTNLPLYIDVVKHDYPNADVRSFSVPDALADPAFFPSVPSGCLFVCDEAWSMWGSGLRMSDAPLEQKEFLSKHRHRVDKKGKALEIVLLTQDLSQMPSFVRALVEQTCIVTKLSALGSKIKSRIDTYSGAVTGSLGPKARLITSSFFSCSKKIYRYYRSHTLSEAGLAGDETKVDRHGVIWKSPFFLFGVLFVIGTFAFGGWKIYGLFSGKASLVRSKHVVAATVGARTSAAALPVVAVHSSNAVQSSPLTEYSNLWRLGGVLVRADGSGEAIVTYTDGTERFISLSFCHPIKSELSWMCEVDGKMVTDWTGVARAVDTVVPVPTLIEPTAVPVATPPAVVHH